MLLLNNPNLIKLSLNPNAVQPSWQYTPTMSYSSYVSPSSIVIPEDYDEQRINKNLPSAAVPQEDEEKSGSSKPKKRKGWWSYQMKDWTPEQMQAVLDKYGKEGLTNNTYRYLTKRVNAMNVSANTSPSKPEYGDVYTPYIDNMKVVRGVRNNNFGNIRVSSTNWDGKIKDNTDGVFEQFQTPELGVRAMVINLRNYYNLYNKRNIRDIISKWAPANENKTQEYIDFVSKYCNVSPLEDVSDRLFTDDAFMLRLIKAITLKENGQNNLNDLGIDVDGVLERGLQMANQRNMQKKAW